MALAQTSAQPSSLTTGHTNHQDPLAVLDSIGKRVDPVYSQTLHIKVKELLHFSHSGFPGSQPVPFETKHLTILEREDYFVCEKSDGVRCLLLFTYSTKGPATFMLDRNQLWYYVPNVLFPVRGRDNEYLKDTLMDGEIVMDHGENGNKTYRFLIFDLMASNGMSIIQRSFNTRLGMLQQDVIQSYKHNLRTQSDPPPFTIELKKMERSYGLRLVFEQISKLRHNSDGIIWTPVKCPYVPGKCEKLLKWKPPEKNTVDFRINAKWSKDHKPIYTLDVLSHLTYKFFDHFQPDSDWALEWKDQPPDGRIAEFRYDPNWQVTIVEQGYAPTTRTGGWRFVRFRDDKDAANEESDVKKILHSIKDGVSKEQLFTHMECIRDAWKAREKGLPPPTLAHLKNRGRLSISNVSNSSSSNQPMMTPTAVSPVFPSPAANNLSSSSSHGYFYGDHSVKSRQNSMDSGSAERRYSMADATTDTKTETTPLDSNNSKDSDVALTQSLPVSRKQSLETSPKRDSNGNGMEETERKRHKSLSELDKVRKIQNQAEKRDDKVSDQVTNNKDSNATATTTPGHLDKIIKKESPMDDTRLTTCAPTTKDPLAKDTVISNHPTKPIDSANHSPISHSLSPVKEEGAKAMINDTRRRKTTTGGNDGQQQQQRPRHYVDNKDEMEDRMQHSKHRKLTETHIAPRTPSINSKPGSNVNYENGSGVVSNQQQEQQEQQMVAPDESLETADLSKRHGKHHSNPTGPAINVFQNGVTTTTVGTIQQRNQGSHYARYDPARSPPPSLSSSSSSSIPKSPHMVTSTHLQYGSALPPSSLTSPSLTQASSFNNNNRKESSHSIHNLLTSSVEPVSHSPKKSEPTFVTPVTTSTYSGRSSSSTRPYNLSSLLHDNTQQKEANDVGYRSKEVHHPRIQPPPQQQHRQQQPYQQMPLERSQAANIPNSSSARTPPVQFINFHADRPRAQNSPTTQQKTIFIQGEYHNNASDPPTKSRSASIVRSNTPPQHHQWQQPSGPETISPQTTTSSTIKRSNHRPSQTSSSTTSSPSSSPRDSRRSGSYNVWRATGQQQQPTPNYGVGTNHPAQAHYYHSQQQHQYQQQQQYYDGSNNSDQHATLGGVHPHHHLHQQSIRPVTESTEYHCDPSTPSQHHHPPYQDMYRPPQYHGQSTLTTTVSSSSLPPPEKKSDKAKLDFILN